MVKLAFVGCGEVQHRHCSCLAALDGVSIAGHADVDGERAELAAGSYGGQAFSDSVKMLDQCKPDALFVATPPFARGEVEKAAAQRGIHLFLEKPLALDAKNAKSIGAAIRKNKIVSCVGYCLRYHDTVTAARQFLRGKAISLVSAQYICALDLPSWRGQMDKSGGQLVAESTPIIDLVRYLCGEIAEVYAAAATGCMRQNAGFDIPESCAMTMRLKNGAAGVLRTSCISANGSDIMLEVVTPEATVRLTGGGVLTIIEDEKTTICKPALNVYEEQAKAFVEAVAAGKKGRIRSTYSDGLKTLLVSLAGNDSIVSGLPVTP